MRTGPAQEKLNGIEETSAPKTTSPDLFARLTLARLLPSLRYRHVLRGTVVSRLSNLPQLPDRSGEFLRFPGADVSGDPFISNPGPAKWFNTDSFKVQTPFTPRLNPYQYDGITGPVFWNADGNVSKTFPIKERYRLEFRFEAYNLTNSLMWANPNVTPGNSLFGRSTAQANTNRGREMQYTLRLQF